MNKISKLFEKIPSIENIANKIGVQMNIFNHCLTNPDSKDFKARNHVSVSQYHDIKRKIQKLYDDTYVLKKEDG